jgi:tetratricopeptide (TPR) repeat protein
MHSLDQTIQHAVQKISTGDILAGRQILKEILQLKQSNSEVERLIGITYALQKKFSESLAWFQKAIQTSDRNSMAYMNMGSAYQAMGIEDKALENYDQSIEIEPRNLEALKNRGNLYFQRQKYQQALLDYEKAECLAVNDTDTLIKKIAALMKLQKYTFAYETSRKINNLNNAIYEAWFYRGISSLKLGNYDEAEIALKKANELNSNAIEVYVGLSAVLQKKGCKKEALEYCEQGISLDSRSAEMWLNKGRILEEFGKIDLAEVAYKKSIENKIDYIEAHKNLASLYLKSMRLNEGWQEYEWRQDKSIAHKQKEWSGESVKNLHVIAEQGIGDQILYASMFNELQGYAENIRISCAPKLRTIFTRSFPKIYFVSDLADDCDGASEKVISLASLPKYLRKSIEDFPSKIEPYIKDNPEISKNIRKKIYPAVGKLCGLSWFSINSENGKSKSIQLEDLLQLMRLEGYTFINLQYGDVGYEMALLKEKYNIEVLNIGEIDLFEDVESLASMITICDVVVTTSNSTAHLSGAMGKETYVLVPNALEKYWYWVEINKRSLWYPSIQVFESSSQSWTKPITELAELIKYKCH